MDPSVEATAQRIGIHLRRLPVAFLVCIVATVAFQAFSYCAKWPWHVSWPVVGKHSDCETQALASIDRGCGRLPARDAAIRDSQAKEAEASSADRSIGTAYRRQVRAVCKPAQSFVQRL